MSQVVGIDRAVDAGAPAGASADTGDGSEMTLFDFHSWFAERGEINNLQVQLVPFADLSGWSFRADTGDLVHSSGRFFMVEGLRVQTDRRRPSVWTQPIIVQPEIGILGILLKEIGGVLHCLMQAKAEPGNVNGLQLSPTVQATRSNYTRVHGGQSVTYIEHFVQARRGRVLVDVLQSEQGAWFLHKRNRNMVVLTDEDVPLDDDFCWLTLHQLGRLLQHDNLVNMDARSVLACLPPTLTFSRPGMPAEAESDGLPNGARHAVGDLLSWLTEVRAGVEFVQRRVPLRAAEDDGWRRSADRIARVDGRYFEIVGVDVRGTRREVGAWRQPLIAPVGPGLVALLMTRFDGMLHVLVHARVEAGTLNVAELAPTVQCRPDNYQGLPEEDIPVFLRRVQAADPAHIRYDVMLSEEGGRFLYAENRYMLIEVDDGDLLDPPDDFRWLTLRQLRSLSMHSNYLNVEMRTLLACAQAL